VGKWGGRAEGCALGRMISEGPCKSAFLVCVCDGFCWKR
jgi:hypothetical protein